MAPDDAIEPMVWRGKALVAAGRIRELAASRGAGAALPGERELARGLGVSRRTLQNALHVLEACGVLRAEHGRGNFVEPEGRWRDLPEPGWQLLVVAPWGRGRPPADDYFLSELLAGMEIAAGAAGARLVGMPADEWPAGEGGRRLAARFRGAVLVDPPGGRWAARLLEASDWHVVALEHNIRDLPVTSVADGSFLGTYDAAAALLRLGHERIAFIDRADWQSANPVKSDGWLAALEEAGGEASREIFRTVPHPPEDAAVRAVMDELAGLSAPPTAVVCYSDNAALVALAWARERGLVPGRDLSVIGSGDQAFRRGLRKDLSSVRVHYRRMGETAALEALCGRRSGELRTVIVPNRLKLRASVGPPLS